MKLSLYCSLKSKLVNKSETVYRNSKFIYIIKNCNNTNKYKTLKLISTFQKSIYINVKKDLLALLLFF